LAPKGSLPGTCSRAGLDGGRRTWVGHCGKAMSAIPHPLASAATVRPDAIALSCEGQDLSFLELRDAAARGATFLADRGGKIGSRIALVGEPSVEWVTAFHAVGWLGGIAQPLSPRLPSGGLLRLMERFEPDMVLFGEGVDVPAEWAQKAAPLVECLGDEPSPHRPWPVAEIRIEIASSGTGGEVRAIPLTGRQIFYSAVGSAMRLGHEPTDAWLACLPLHHVGGLSILLRCGWYGTRVVLHPRFDEEQVIEALDSGEVSQVSLVPLMLERLLERGFSPRDGLRFLLVGGSPPASELQQACRDLSLPVAWTWGMTETASQVATRTPGDLRPLEEGCPPLAFARVSVEQDALVVEGPLAPGGRLCTRDGGRIVDGRVAVSGRLDDVILSGGENVHPGAVEGVLEAHPGVEQVVVVGRPDSKWGERPVAWMVAGDDSSRPSDEELREWCGDRLADFEVPDAFRWTRELPSTELGKPSRAQVQGLEAQWPSSAGST